MKTNVLITTLLCCSLTTSLRAASTNQVKRGWQENVLVYQGGDWELQVEYLHRGTRSEGQHGRLYKLHEEVEETEKGLLKNTSLGTLKYYGADRNQAWDHTGWLFSDRSRNLSSRSVPTLFEAPKDVKRSPQPGESVSVVVLDGGNANSEVSVQSNSELSISLPGSPSTGFKWTYLPGKEPSTQLTLIESGFKESTAKNRLGAPGSFHFVFTSAGAGQQTLAFSYGRPWEATKKPERTFNVLVTIEE